MKQLRLVLLLLMLNLLVSMPAFCQPGDPASGGNPTTPITGIEILIGLGSLLGIKKLVGRKKNKID